MKKPKGTGNSRDARFALVRLQSHIFLSAFTPSDVRGYMSTYLRYASTVELQRNIPRLLQKGKILESLFPIRRELSGIFAKDRFKLEEDRLSLLYRVAIDCNSMLLRNYFKLSRNFELALLYGDYSTCLAILDEIFEVSGYSMWLIRSRILVLSKMGRLDEMNQYYRECCERANDGFVSFFINCFVFLATNPLLHSRRVIKSAVDELDASSSTSWADLISLMLLPSPLFRAKREMDCFSAIQLFPLIDQVVLLEQLVANNSALGGVSTHLENIAQCISRMRSDDIGASLDDLAKEYEREDYSKVILTIEGIGELGPCSVIRSANLVAKSQAIIGFSEPTASRSVIRDLVSALRGLYSLEGATARLLDSIRSLILQMQYLSFGRSLTLLMYQVLPNQVEAAERAFAAKRAIYLEKAPTPWLKVLAGDVDPLISHNYLLDDENIPQHRRVKRRARDFCRSKKVNDVKLTLEEYKYLAPLLRDYCELASSVLLELSDFPALIRICGAALSENQAAHSAFPLAQLIEYIERETIADVDALLVINAYVRNVSKSKGYLLNETFEEFLFANGAESPSALTSDCIEMKKLAVVLRDVCSLDNLDFLSIYESSSDVRAERIRILDRLLHDGGIKPEQHRDEVEDILLQALVDNVATEISAQKIYVDDQELRRRLIDDVKSLFDLYRASAESSDRDFIRIEDAGGEEPQRAALIGDKNTTLQKIYHSVRESFLFDERYGLDKNLSAEIRHGFFSNLMRSKLSARHLITEKGDDGEYKGSPYWREVNGILVEDALIDIENNLRWFSSEFNQSLARAEEWMKVTVQADSSRVFRYATYGDTFLPIKRFADVAEDAESVLDHIIDSLWMMTEQHLAEMRNRLDGAFRQEIDKLFEELIGRLEVAKGDTSLSDLIGAIRMARNEVKEDISVIREWFKRSEALSGKPRTLRELVAISIECYSRVRGIEVQLSFEKSDGLIDISLAGKESKSLVLALMNLYENSIAHSGLGTQTPIGLRARSIQSGGWELSVTNPVTDVVAEMLSGGGLVSIQQRIKDPSFAKLVMTEGGSGLRKVINQLADVGRGCDLSIQLEGREFTASISYG